MPASDLRRGLGDAALAVHRLSRRVRNRLFSMAVAGGFRGFGRGTVLDLPVKLGGTQNIELGSDVYVGPGSWLMVLSDKRLLTAAIRIGDRTQFAGNAVVTAAAEVVFGTSVLVARNVYISDHSHATADPQRPVRDQGIDGVRPVHIGDGAWIGQNAVILPGVRIGRGAVVGAISVVGADVPDRSLAVGAPARVIKHLDTAGHAIAGSTGADTD
jgi:acetyltransferase-like isoleucine patch superfamily enzyme